MLDTRHRLAIHKVERLEAVVVAAAVIASVGIRAVVAVQVMVAIEAMAMKVTKSMMMMTKKSNPV